MSLSKKTALRSLPILLGCILISACSGVTSQEQVHFADREGADIFTDIQNGVSYAIVPAKSGDSICRTPAPDALTGESDSTALSFAGQSVGADQSFSVDGLGGRSPEVLIARELMYRLCELSVNVRLSKEEALKIYGDTIGKITDMVKSASAETGTDDSGYSGTVTMETIPSSTSSSSAATDDTVTSSSSATDDTVTSSDASSYNDNDGSTNDSTSTGDSSSSY